MNNKRLLTSLAVIAAATLNIACWWLFTQCPATSNWSCSDNDNTLLALDTETDDAVPNLGEMSAISARQNNLFADRIASINVDFNYPLDRASITPETLQIIEDGHLMNWTLDESGVKSICIKTAEPVKSSTVTVKILKGITSYRKGVLASSQEQVLIVPITNDFGINRLSVWTPPVGDPIVTIGFTKPADISKASESIICDPPVDLNFAQEDGWGYYWGRNLDVSGKFEIGKQYTMTFRKGMRSSEGYVLESTLTRQFTIPHRSADVRFAVSGRYLPPDGELAVPITVVNTTNVNISVSTVPPQNIVQLMARESSVYRSHYTSSIEGWDTLELASPAKKSNILINVTPNTTQREMIHLSEYMEGKKRGVLLVQVDGIDLHNDDQKSDARLICVSDLGISARLAKNVAHVWVTSLRTGTPVAEATVRIYAKNNTVIAEGTSDAHGLARISFTSRDPEPFVVTAETQDGSDLSFIPITNATSVDENNSASGEYSEPGACKAFLFTDRRLYRHGETIHLQALLRNESNEAPSPFPVNLEVIRPDGRTFMASTLMPDEEGCLTAEPPITIPEDQPSGSWTMQISTPGDHRAVLGYRTVSIESFVPPQIRVSLRALPEGELFDLPLSFTVHAEHLFGKAAGGLKASAAVSYSTAKFSPEGWTDYVFGNTSRSVKSNYTVVGQKVFDEEGNAQFSLPVDANLLPPEMLTAVLEGTAFEPGGRPLSMRTSVSLHRYPHYIAVKAPESKSLSVSTTNTLSIAVVGRDGLRLADSKELVIELLRLSRIYGFTRGDNGQYIWKNEIIQSPVSKTTLSSIPDSDLTYNFSVGTSGEYRLVVTDPATDSSTSYSFSATQGAMSSTRSDLSNPSKVEMSFDKPHYLAGEIAKLTITTPFIGTALFSLQRDGILKSEILPMTNTTTLIEIPVTDNFYPNIQATVSIIRPAEAEETWSAHRASGLALLKVERPEDKLDVTSTTSVEIIDGGSTVKVLVDLNARDASDISYATVFVTDEAIHMLTDEKVPDPYEAFSLPCASATTLNDVFSLLMPVTAEIVSGNSAKIGGDGSEPLMRRISPVASRRFKPLSLAAKSLRLLNGHAEYTFKLPEFAGEVRVTVVAWNKTATGATSVNCKVSPKLVARPDAPRFLACGDRAKLTLSIHNQSDADAAVAYTLAFLGSLTGDRVTQSIILKAGESKILKLDALATDEVGQGLATFRIEGAGEKHEEILEIPVRPAMPLMTQVECFPLAEGQSLVLPVPAHLIPSTVVQSLRCHNSSFAEFTPALSFLLDYPYGCLEQTTSSAFPLIHAGGALTRIAISDEYSIQETLNKVRSAVQRVNALQTSTGYLLWSDVYRSDDMTSVYACHFLAEAAKAGVGAVQKSTLEANASFLRITASRAYANTANTLSAYCCHVLALSGKPEKTTMLALYDVRSNLSAEGKAHLARAFAISGDQPRALDLMKSIEAPTSMASAAFGILAWLELDSPDAQMQIASLYAYLLKQKEALRIPHWGTTRDNALTLLAISALAQRQADPDAKLFVALSQEQSGMLATITNRTTTAKAGSAMVTAMNKGQGTAYLLRTLSAVPSKLDAVEKKNGITISRLYRNLAGEFVDLSTLTPGDPVVVELSIRLQEDADALDDAVVEELIPACIEPEPGSLAASGTLPWIDREEENAVLRREVRDDRLLFFLNKINATATIHYSARVVSSGEFTVPPASIEGMYRPDINARTAPSTVVIRE